MKDEEERTAKALGGRRTFNSGAGDEKGDGRVPHSYQVNDGEVMPRTSIAYRIENKTTSTGGYRLSALDWEKLRNAAIQQGEEPLFVILLKNTRTRLVAMEAGTADEIVLSPRGQKMQPAPLSAAKGFTISTKVWAHEQRQGDRIPHIRVLLRGTRSNDLVIVDWEWLVASNPRELR